MGLIAQAVNRALPISNAARGGVVQRAAGTVATASGIPSQRQARVAGAAMYRNWAIHGEIARGGLDFKIGQLTKAEYELVPFDIKGPKPDRGLMDRMYEILRQPNPGEDGLGTFFQQLGEDLWTLDAAPFEKERTFRGELTALWPIDGNTIAIDRFWNGDPKSPRYWYVPRPEIAIPMLISDLGYMKQHTRSYSPMGIPPFETLRATIESELSGSAYNSRQVAQAAPDGIMDLGENARPDQVEAFKSLWSSLIAGKSMMAFWGGTKSAKFIPFKTGNREMQFIEWQEYLLRKFCVVMQMSPQDLGFSFDINKSTGEVQQGQTDDKGLTTLSRVQDIMTAQFCWDPSFGGVKNNIAFRFTAVSDRASKAKADISKITLASMPSDTINEARKASGKPPIGDPNDENNPFNKLMANTPQGLVILDDIPTARELAMRGMNADGTPVEEPDPDAPKGIEAYRDLVMDLSKSHASSLTELTSAIAGRPVVVEAPVTIEKGAVVVEHHAAEQTMHLVSPESESLLEAASGMRELASDVRKSFEEPPVVNVAPPEVNVAPPDLTPIVDAINVLKDAMARPRDDGPVVRREVKRDVHGRIIDVIEHREG